MDALERVLERGPVDLVEDVVADLDRVLEALGSAAADPDEYLEWEELNGLKYLFRGKRSWTVDDMARLVTRSVDYLGAGR